MKTAVRLHPDKSHLRIQRLELSPLSPSPELLQGQLLLRFGGEGERPREDRRIRLLPTGLLVRVQRGEEASLQGCPVCELQTLRTPAQEVTHDLLGFLPRRLQPEKPLQKLL